MHEVLTAGAARLHRRTERRGHAGTAVPRRALRARPGGGGALRAGLAAKYRPTVLAHLNIEKDHLARLL